MTRAVFVGPVIVSHVIARHRIVAAGGPRVATGRSGGSPSSRPAPSRNGRAPRWRSWNTWVRNGMKEATPATPKSGIRGSACAPEQPQLSCQFNPGSNPVAIDLETAQRRRQIVDKAWKGTLIRRGSPDHDEIVAALGVRGHHLLDGGTQPASNPVANNGFPDLLADREADTKGARPVDTCLFRHARARLKDQARRDPLPPRTRDPQEFGPLFQARYDGGHDGITRRGACVLSHGDWPEPGDRPRLRCGRGNHADACGRGCSVGTCVSRLNSYEKQARCIRACPDEVNGPGRLFRNVGRHEPEPLATIRGLARHTQDPPSIPSTPPSGCRTDVYTTSTPRR